MSELSLYNATDDTFHLPIYAGKVEVPEMLRTALVHGIWTGIIFVLAIAMVVVSTPQHRRSPPFAILCLAFVMLALNASLKIAWAFVHMRNTFIYPEDSLDQWQDFHLHKVTFVLEKYICLVADSSIIFKVLSFFPHPVHPRSTQRAIVAPQIVILLTRTGLVGFFSAKTWGDEDSDMRWQSIRVGVEASEMLLQAVYCSYGSALLFRQSLSFYRSTATRFNSLARRRIRFFIESIFFTYFIPLTFQLACALDLLFVDADNSHYAVYGSVNTYTTVIFSLLATIWSTIRGRPIEGADSSSSVAADSDKPVAFNGSATLFSQLIRDDYSREHVRAESNSCVVQVPSAQTHDDPKLSNFISEQVQLDRTTVA